MKLKFPKKIFTIFLLLLLTNCAENITESVESIGDSENINVSSTFSDIQVNILDQSCAFSGCHSSGAVNPDLSGNSFSNIVNQPSSTGMNYITPNDPDNSYLLQKVMPNGNFQGSIMPRNASQLSQEQIDAIIDWINEGAQNN